MAVDPVPFFVGGGDTGAPEHSPEVVRQFIYDSTSGAEGVSDSDSMRVLAMPTPSNKVRVMPGGGLMNNRYAGGERQSYDGRVTSQTEVPITATGSTGGRTDMVILRILDPQYEGQPPADWNAFQFTRLAVVEGVSSAAKTAADLNLPYPAIALARVTIPKSTATITSAMITDLRQVANPQSFRRALTIYPTQNHVMPTTGYGSWPILSAQRPTLFVPPWATRLEVVAHYSGIGFTGSARTVAAVRTGFGVLGGEGGILIETTAGRGHYTVAGSHAVLPEQRGTDQLLNLQAARTVGAGIFEADYQSAIIVDYQFTQEAS